MHISSSECSLLVLDPLVSFSIKATAVGYPSRVFEIMKGTSRAFEVPTKPAFLPTTTAAFSSYSFTFKTRRRDNAVLLYWVWVFIQFPLSGCPDGWCCKKAECVWGGRVNWPTSERQCSKICMFSCTELSFYRMTLYFDSVYSARLF